MSAATNRDHYRRIAHRYRHLPGRYGLRVYTVALVTRTWSGDHPGEGTETETVTTITERDGQSPKVRFLDDEALALGGLAKGSAEIGPITPDFSGGGNAIATLTQSSAVDNDLVLVRLVGPQGTAYYRITDVTDHKALHYTIRVSPLTE